MYFIISILLSIILLPLTILYIHFSRRFSFWKKKGIPGPEPSFPLGTLTYYFNKTVAEAEDELAHKFGTMVGMFDAGDPVLLVSDPKMIREVCISKFSSFTGVKAYSYSPIIHDMLIFKEGSDWKKQRSLINPVFTPSKIKVLHKEMSVCGQRLTNYLDKCIANGKNELKAQDFAVLFTLDVISRLAFSTEIDPYPREDRKEDNFSFYAKRLTTNVSHLTYIAVLMLPDWINKILSLNPFDHKSTNFFTQISVSLVDKYSQLKQESGEKSSGKKTKQLVEMMLENMEKKDVLSNVLLVFIAGFESTSILLSFLMYILSQHPEVQETLVEELNSVELENENYVEALMKLDYLEAVIQETLRMYPPVVNWDRVASEDVTFDCGLSIPARTIIRVPVYHIQHNKENYPDPEIFDPQRFLPGNIENNLNSFIHLPFVEGPRVCLGKYLALLEVKCFLYHVLPKFVIKKSPKAPVPMVFEKSVKMLKPTDGYVILEKRK